MVPALASFPVGICSCAKMLSAVIAALLLEPAASVSPDAVFPAGSSSSPSVCMSAQACFFGGSGCDTCLPAPCQCNVAAKVAASIDSLLMGVGGCRYWDPDLVLCRRCAALLLLVLQELLLL